MLKLSVGDMRHRVKLQTPSQVADGAGGFTVTWTDTATLWAKVEGLNVAAREAVRAAAERSTVRWLVTVRYRTDITFAPDCRLLWTNRSDRTLKILSTTELPSDGHFLTIECEEELPS